MTEEKTIEELNNESNSAETGTNDFSEFDNALSANLDALYESGFAQEKPEESEPEPELDSADFKVDIDKVLNEPLVVENEETPEEEETGDVTEIGDDVFKDINDALALQINNEMKKERRKKKNTGSKWWLLSLIPFLGVLVLFIRPLRKNMPKWFMLLRVMILFAFTLFVLVIFIQVVDEGLQEAAETGEMSIKVDWDTIKTHIINFFIRK